MKRQPELIIMCGLPGSGKSTAARYIAKQLRGRLLVADVVRRQMFETRTYSEEERQVVYEELLRRAAPLLSEGVSVVLDATYLSASHREDAFKVGERFDAKCRVVHVTCTEEVAKERIQQRVAQGSDASEADVAVYLKLKNALEPIRRPHSIIDNSSDYARLKREIAEVL